MKFENEKALEFLTEWNDGACIAHLQALKWGTLQGQIEFLKDHFDDITTRQAKQTIKEWLIDRGLETDAERIII